ncbi:MAG: cardiolipin synthase [Polyangiales bacterium]|jgi:cardiolipin synthase
MGHWLTCVQYRVRPALANSLRSALAAQATQKGYLAAVPRSEPTPLLQNATLETSAKEPMVVGPHKLTLLHDGAECFGAMLGAIRHAKTEILLEMYWFASDTIGWRVARALMERAEEGLEVRVLYDAIGSLEASETMFDAMRAGGVRVLQFNPIAPWRRRFRPERLTRRNHRKMLLIDSETGLTGGVNIGDPWLPISEGGQGWRDDMIRVDGPAAMVMREIFLHAWRHEESSGGREGRLKLGNEDDGAVRVLANHYYGTRRAIRRTYLNRIRAAKRSVLITNSYFVPDRMIRMALAKAASRGVEVRVLVPGISDVKAVYYASRKLYAWLVERGVHVHEWMPHVLHSKTAVVDGTWCTVGTYNLDYLSWRSNLEVTLAVDDDQVAGALEGRFRADLDQAMEIDMERFGSRPLSERFLEQVFFWLRKFL